MLPAHELMLFALAALVMVLTPGPNMVYLVSRSLHGSVLGQSVQLGLIQISVSFSVNLVLILSAARLAAWFARNPLWLAVQRWVMGFVLAGLAVRLALDSRRN